jgi:hypothetical protein
MYNVLVNQVLKARYPNTICSGVTFVNLNTPMQHKQARSPIAQDGSEFHS